MEALAKVQKDFSIDPDRVYIAGQSMGGLGVWSLLQNYRGKWAGAIVMSAYDTFSDIPAIAEVPLWVFQGDDDQSVPVDMVRSMMKQLKKAHANLRYTEYHKSDHDVWTKAFAEPDLLPWLSAQKRGALRRRPSWLWRGGRIPLECGNERISAYPTDAGQAPAEARAL